MTVAGRGPLHSFFSNGVLSICQMAVYSVGDDH